MSVKVLEAMYLPHFVVFLFPGIRSLVQGVFLCAVLFLTVLCELCIRGNGESLFFYVVDWRYIAPCHIIMLRAFS